MRLKPKHLFPIYTADNYPRIAHNRSMVSFTISADAMYPRPDSEGGLMGKENTNEKGKKTMAPHPPTLNPRFLKGGNQAKSNKINSLIDSLYVLISKHRPRKTTYFWPKVRPLSPVSLEKRPVRSNFEGRHFRLCLCDKPERPQAFLPNSAGALGLALETWESTGTGTLADSLTC